MKLTEQNVSDSDLKFLINFYDGSVSWVAKSIFMLLLELKQRRDEDRKLDYESNPALDPCNQPENIR